jgi:hypothetical protein
VSLSPQMRWSVACGAAALFLHGCASRASSHDMEAAAALDKPDAHVRVGNARTANGDLADRDRAIAATTMAPETSDARAPLTSETTRFRCAGGETPVAVRTGCMCGSGIHNPCKTGGLFPVVVGATCVFECPPELPERTPVTDMERCLKRCNDETAWRFMGQCQTSCEHEAELP